MSDVVINSENLGKMYTIGHQANRGRYVALRDVLVQNAKSLWSKTKDMVHGRPVIQGDTLEEVWALKDVNFEIKRGEAVGIIGRNGAGKSTLLKVLSRITEPTSGRVSIKGRVSSLLEVGTGFHPELTGRENIFLNGAILGMTRSEIRSKFDEIVAFAEVEKFLDTPVKRYSSGMYVRLAFAVAAHLEPEILLVDEVLAVGDMAFQKKCLGKMGSVAKEGRTVLFVSHNMGAIRSLCQRTLVVENGTISFDGPSPTAIDNHLNLSCLVDLESVVYSEQLQKNAHVYNPSNQAYFCCEEIALLNRIGNPTSQYKSNEEIIILVRYRCYKTIPNFHLVITVVSESGEPIVGSDIVDHVNMEGSFSLNIGTYESRCVLPANIFGEKKFFLNVRLMSHGEHHVVYNKILCFEVFFQGYNFSNYSTSKDWEGYIRPSLQWTTEVLR